MRVIQGYRIKYSGDVAAHSLRCTKFQTFGPGINRNSLIEGYRFIHITGYKYFLQTVQKLLFPLFCIAEQQIDPPQIVQDRKSTRLNSSHVAISYAVFCLTKKYLYP